jgi:hypothetical protein
MGADGNFYVSDEHFIRKITMAGEVTTLAGGDNGRECAAGRPACAHFRDGPGSLARFHFPGGIARTSNGDLYVTDLSNQRIRKLVME